MRVLVCHHTLNTAGGGERVALHVIKLAQDMGFDVELATTEPTDWDHVQRVIGIRLSKIPREHSLFPFKLRAFGIYQRFLTGVHASRLRKGFDLTINTHGDVMALPTDVTYLHFPTLAYWRRGELRPYSKYLKSLFWFIYFQPYRLMEERLIDWCFGNSLILTNSEFSREAIREILGRDALVIYPPVEVNEYLKLPLKGRRDAVVYIARFSEEKNNHMLVHIAKELPDVDFYLIGSVRGKGVEYYNYCCRLKERLGVRNLKIMPNLPHEDKLKVLSMCKVYVHLMQAEHFGIAPVEAMAAGLIPIVHMSGGAWSDVVACGKFGFGYSRLDPKEIADSIEKALSSWSSMVGNVRERSMEFSVEKFRVRFGKVLEEFV